MANFRVVVYGKSSAPSLLFTVRAANEAEARQQACGTFRHIYKAEPENCYALRQTSAAGERVRQGIEDVRQFVTSWRLVLGLVRLRPDYPVRIEAGRPVSARALHKHYLRSLDERINARAQAPALPAPAKTTCHMQHDMRETFTGYVCKRCSYAVPFGGAPSILDDLERSGASIYEPVTAADREEF